MSLAGAMWFAVQDDLYSAVNDTTTTTTSSNSSSTQEKHPIQNSISTNIIVPILASDTHTLLDRLDDRFLSQCFHLNRQCLRFIVDFIQARLKKDVFAASYNLSSSEAKILATLSFYAHGSLPCKVTDRLGIDQTSAGEAVKSLTKLLSGMSPDFITFPYSYNDRMGAAQAFKNISGIPHVVGVLGYLHVKVTPPPGEEYMYKNSLGYHSVMMQVIFDVDGNLLSVEQCWPGGTPEDSVWASSDIGKQFSTFRHGHTWVLGGRGMFGGGHVLTPVDPSRLKSNAAHRFNKAHAQVYGRMQQVFGSLKSRFQCLRDFGSIQTLESVACTITACCVLHNISKKFSVQLPWDFAIEPLHPFSEVNYTADPPYNYMQETKDEMIGMFFTSAEDN